MHVEALAFGASDVEHDAALVQHHRALADVERLAHRVRDHHRGELGVVSQETKLAGAVFMRLPRWG